MYNADGVFITGIFSADLIEIARTQLGYKELSVSTGEPLYNGIGTWYTKYGDLFNNSPGAWCAFFVMWCAEKAEVPKTVIPQAQTYGNCGAFVNWFKNRALWQEADYLPSKGDIIFFDWESDGLANHVGIVSQVESDGTIHTVEGNVCADLNGVKADNGYYQVVTLIRSENILGFGTPDYGQPNAFITGDINLDGSISEADGQLILQYTVGSVQLSTQQLSLADIDGNSVINAADAARIFINLNTQEEIKE